MMQLGKDLGVLEVFLFDVIATGRLESQRHCMLGAEEIAQVKRFREEYNRRPDYPRIIHQTMFTSVAYPCAAEGCPAGHVQVHLRANGDVSPCDFTPVSFGNIRSEPLKTIWGQLSGSELYAAPSECCRLANPAYWARLEAMAANGG